MSSDFSTEKACIPVAEITKHENGQFPFPAVLKTLTNSPR